MAIFGNGRSRLVAALFSTLFSLTATIAPSDELTENFDDDLLDPETFEISTPDGYGVVVSSGKARFTKDEGIGDGFSRLSTLFTLKGDFEITVLANRTNAAGNAVIGLATTHFASGSSGGGFTDVYFRGPGLVISNMFVDPVHEQVVLNDTSSPVTFRIRRIGDRVVHECDPGFGYIHVSEATDPALSGPVRFYLFLGQEEGSTVAHSATFDDLFAEADVFSPPCGDGVLEGDEACDDDEPAWVPGAACSASCATLACGDTDDSGSITATDGLFILRTSVGVSNCDACVCDVDSSGGTSPTTASDALRVLQNAVGGASPLVCPPCANTLEAAGHR